MNRRPRLLGFFHAYPPNHNAGAEWMVHAMLTELKRSYGWDVKVVVGRLPRRNSTWQDIPVEAMRDPRRWATAFGWCDVAMTHLDVTRQAMTAAARARVPLVHVLHNTDQLDFHRVRPQNAQLLVANSQSMAEHHSDWPGPLCVVHPPVWCSDYEVTKTGDAVTLVNLYWEKGAPVLWRIARAMPDVEFLAVKGGYGEQEAVPADVDNVTVIANTPNITDVFRRSRLMLMPSRRESWGRVCVEAAAAGIPSITSRTSGLVETRCPAFYLDPEDIDGWVDAIRYLLDDRDAWREAGRAARAQALELERQSHQQLAHLDWRMRRLMEDTWQQPTETTART